MLEEFRRNMKILIARHADPDYENDSLTERGFLEAKSLAKRLATMKIDYVYVSPLGRARATAREYENITGKTADVKEFLREFNHKISIVDGEKTYGMNQPWDFLPSYYAKNGDLGNYDKFLETNALKSGNVKNCYDAVIKEFDELLSFHGYERNGALYSAKKPNEDVILLFCHFGIECVLLSHLFGISSVALGQSFCCLPSGVTTIVTEERERGVVALRCMGFGDLSHLYSDKIEPSFSARFCERFTDDTRH